MKKRLVTQQFRIGTLAVPASALMLGAATAGTMIGLSVLAQSPTAFTYQGYLQDSSTNANGLYTNVFALYDSISNGNQLASPITVFTTPTNGYFTTSLDFGSGPFVTNGGNVWLDVQIDGEELVPRQLITPAPLAANVATNSNATVGGENNLKIVRGSINGDGSIALGGGFDCTLFTDTNLTAYSTNTYGYYQITFTHAFSAPPVITFSSLVYIPGGFYNTFSPPVVSQRSNSGFVIADKGFNYTFATTNSYGGLDNGWIILSSIYNGVVTPSPLPTNKFITDFIAIGPQ